MKDEIYYENPCCVLNNDIETTKKGFAYFSRSKDIVSDLCTGIIDFNDTPVMTDIFDYNRGTVTVKATGWYYIQYVVNMPFKNEISTYLAVYKCDEALEGTIIEISNKESVIPNCYGAQTVSKLEKGTKINIKSTKHIDLKLSKSYENSLSLFILKLI